MKLGRIARAGNGHWERVNTPPVPVLLVTGASGGIGRATARAAAGRGFHLVLAARGADALEEVATSCREAGAPSVLAVPTDVGRDTEVAALIRSAVQERGRLEAVVHCAGVAAYGRTEDVPPAVFDGVIRTNLTGSVNIARHVIPVLREQRCGTLVLVGSVIGHLGVPTMSPYVLSKWGVRALARQLQLENRDIPQVRIRYAAPGGVDTAIYRLAANYAGVEGMPPPPVRSAQHVAEQLLDRIGSGRGRDQLSGLNEVMRLGFTALPRLYDLMVGPLFAVAARDLSTTREPGPGNVLAPVHGPVSTSDRPGWRAVLRNVATLARRSHR